MGKRFILNADDFGLSKSINRAVLESYNEGILKSVSLVANGDYFDEAVEKIIPQCPDLGVGIHLNITSGKSLCSDINFLTDENTHFNNSYIQLLLKAYNPRKTEFFEQLEREFRRQIEKVLSKTPVTHIDSHMHIHAIPKIFDIVCRLAKEYGITQIRTHFEKPYIVPDVQKHLNWIYPFNISKNLIFGLFTIFNEAIAHKYEIATNDYLVGIIYSSLMDALTVSYGTMAVKYDNITLEVFIHPCRYEDGTINNHFDEFMLAKNKKLKNKIERLGFEITNYAKKDS